MNYKGLFTALQPSKYGHVSVYLPPLQFDFALIPQKTGLNNVCRLLIVQWENIFDSKLLI